MLASGRTSRPLGIGTYPMMRHRHLEHSSARKGTAGAVFIDRRYAGGRQREASVEPSSTEHDNAANRTRWFDQRASAEVRMGRGDMSLREVLAKNLRQQRKQLKISQEALADEAGLHRTYVGAIERAERNVSLDNVEKLARALKCNPAELFDGWRR